MQSDLKHIDEARLESDLAYRFGYVSEFMGFTENDIALVLAAAPLLAPAVPALVDAIYGRLFTYDATRRHFMKTQSGFDGPTPASLENVNDEQAVIRFRKGKLSRYLVKLVTGPYDRKMVEYLDIVGKIHTPKAGSPAVNVPLVQMNALMGFVADAIIATLMATELPCEEKGRTIRAFSKLLWIQNDLITRHYQS